jgi:hypothetical protein
MEIQKLTIAVIRRTPAAVIFLRLPQKVAIWYHQAPSPDDRARRKRREATGGRKRPIQPPLKIHHHTARRIFGMKWPIL